MFMKHLPILCLLAGLFALPFTGCYYDNEEDLYPDPNACDTTDISYVTHIAPVLSVQCFSCHAQDVYNDIGGGINLDGHANVNTVAQNNQLYPAIAHTGDFQMPKGGAKLPDCTIAQFKSWIDAGAPNN